MGDPSQTLDLAGRHQLVVERSDRGDSLRLVSPDGATPIVIEVTSGGVTLRIGAPHVAIEAAGDLSIAADRLALRGRQEVSVSSGGDLQLVAAGDLESRAQGQLLRAERGSVDVKASDDVKLAGERVMVNCDETVDRYFRPPPQK
ncbi:MAG TPA: hypothetical protein VHM31_05190 [Polyangia bacterium]|nr:hypothetical protein [Polyangia bacterium]